MDLSEIEQLQHIPYVLLQYLIGPWAIMSKNWLEPKTKPLAKLTLPISVAEETPEEETKGGSKILETI